MNTLICFLLAAGAILFVLCIKSIYGWRPKRAAHDQNAEFANIAEGVYENGVKTYLADAAIATRYFLVKQGSDARHIAVSAAVADKILGVAIDEPGAAEDEVAIAVLGAYRGTIKMVADAAIAAGDYLSSNGNGKVVTAVATRYCVGKALTAASGAGDEIEVAPMLGDRVL